MSSQETPAEVRGPYRWELSVTKHDGHSKHCLEAHPEPLLILKEEGPASRTVDLVASESNLSEVKLVLRNAPLDLYMEDVKAGSREIVLKPGEKVSMRLKPMLGLVQRRNSKNRFTNSQSPYALVLTFDHPDLDDCGHGEHTNWHVEC